MYTGYTGMIQHYGVESPLVQEASVYMMYGIFWRCYVMSSGVFSCHVTLGGFMGVSNGGVICSVLYHTDLPHVSMSL